MPDNRMEDADGKLSRGQNIRRDMWGEGHAQRLSLLRRFEPDLANLVVREGFGGIYADERLSLEQRSLCTITALACQGRHRQLESHIRAALRLGMSVDLLSATFAHLFLYAGLPSVIEALHVLAKALDEEKVVEGQER